MAILLGTIELKSPVFLAPMAGITDVPFRSVAARFGAGLVVSEMVASAEVMCANPTARARAQTSSGDVATAVQLVGNDPRWMAEAARFCTGQGARIVDVNLGCPAKKVTNGWSGSALMRDPDHALRLIEAVVGAVDVPVTVKMRLGWDADAMNAPEIASRAEAAGAAMITVHGRTRCQFYRGSADWPAIERVVNAVDIPVIANGDIVDLASARTALATSRAAGVMVGRGARGKPWLIAGIAADLEGRPPPAVPSGILLIDLVLSHYEAILGFYGRDIGVRVARKHLGWYLDGLEDSGLLRQRVLRMNDPNRVVRELSLGLPDCGRIRERTAA